MTTATPRKHSSAEVVYELGPDGLFRPYEMAENELGIAIPDRAGRKTRTELYAIQRRHELAVAELQERECREGVASPPPELRALPHLATYFLWRIHLLSQYLSHATYQLHRKQIRDLTAIDISIPFTGE